MWMFFHVCERYLSVFWRCSIIGVFWSSFYSKYTISGFRKGHDCQGVPIRFSESIKSSLDNNSIVGATLIIDLWKRIFLSCDLHVLLCNFNPYGRRDTPACELIATYFFGPVSYGKVRICKMWVPKIIKGAHQGSVIGPYIARPLTMLIATLR